MRTVIAVQDVGRSCSINKAYHLLKDAYPAATFEEILTDGDSTIIISINGMKIGIEYQVDPGSRLLNSLARFVKAGCKVIICATRKSGQTFQAVENLASKYLIHRIDPQPYVPNSTYQEAGACSDTAHKIFKAAQEALKARHITISAHWNS